MSHGSADQLRTWNRQLRQVQLSSARHKRLQNALLDGLDAQGRGIRAGDRLDRAELHARP